MARRRLVTAAVAGLLAVTALAGCRAEPGSAAFVGSTRITTGTVDAMLDGLKADGFSVADADQGAYRQQITSTLTFREVAKRFATEQHYPAPQVDKQGTATALSLPSSNAFVIADAEAQAYQALLLAQVTPAQVSDAEYGVIADRLGAQVGPNAPTRDKIIAELKAPELADPIGRAVAVRDELTKAIKGYNVTVNPLFAPAAWDLLQLRTADNQLVEAVVLPLSSGAGTPGAVTDVINPR